MNKRTLSIAAVGLLVGVVGLLVLVQSSSTQSGSQDTAQSINAVDVPDRLSRSALVIDYSLADIELDQILSGGPSKDGIPALTDPAFVQLADAAVTDTTQVIVVEHAGETKIYPYNILVWHEIVNDTVGGKPLAITFCPLCGSAIVFEREIDGQIIDFGVSGFLYESNMLMYSREDNESLWSQSLGRAVVGARTGERLAYYPMQLLTFAQARDQFPSATVLSDSTGFTRDYSGNPYVGYEDTEDTIFPVSVTDRRFPAKEIFYIVPLEGTSVAVRLDKDDGVYLVPDSDVTVEIAGGVVTARWGEAELPGYYEMWFSWATHHQETGEVL